MRAFYPAATAAVRPPKYQAAVDRAVHLLRPQRRVRSARPRGYTLAEVVVSTLIVGVVLVGALNVLGSSAHTNRVAATQLDAPHLGHQLMGEVLALPYEDPEAPGMPIGPDAGEATVTRNDFDDLDDYAGWNQTPPEAKDGTLIPNASGWRREVFVEYFDPATGGTTGTDTGVKLIRVKVSPPSGSSLEIAAIRCRWGALEQDSAIDTTLVNSLDGTLQIGASGLPARSAALLPNHANAP